MIPVVKIELPLPGEKLLIRLSEIVAEKGVSALFRPWQMRREGRALVDVRREDALSLAQTERDVEDVRSGRKSFDASHQLVELHEQASPLAVMHRNRDAREIRGEVNVSKALSSAEEVLADDPQAPPDRTVDDDWLFRWRDAASVVSSEELQTLWGRVFAGEIKSPGSFSLRTLEFLKNISHEEALKIAKLAPFVLNNDCIFRGDEKLLISEGITFGFLLDLQNLGITCGVETTGLTVEIRNHHPDKFQQAFVSHGRVLVVAHEDTSQKLTLEIYGLTSIGRQIFKLGSFKPHEIYLRNVGQAICRKGFNVSLGRWEQVTETKERYYELQELCAKAV